MIILGLWVAGTKSLGPSKPNQKISQGKVTADREIAEIQTVNSRCLKPIFTWSTPNTSLMSSKQLG